jgi:23S rRNA pseudouridine2604 synthase
MAQRGICSRREADEYISRGLVFVDGVKIDILGTKVRPHQTITLAKEAQEQQESLVTILLNKPIGYVSGQPEDGYEPAVELITPENRAADFAGPEFHKDHLRGLAPAGRLDIDSKGLLVFTQDGRLAKQLTGESSGIEKEYLVRIEGHLGDAGLTLLQHGLTLDGRPLLPARVEWINPHQLRFVLTEGRKRQIRRMCQQLDLNVTGLKRVRIGKIPLGKIPEGQWRYLLPGEAF